MSEDRFQPYHLKPTQQQLEQANKKTVKISIKGDTAFLLRHAPAKMGTLKKLSYDETIKLLLIMFELGKGFGIIRDHPKIVAILGER